MLNVKWRCEGPSEPLHTNIPRIQLHASDGMMDRSAFAYKKTLKGIHGRNPRISPWQSRCAVYRNRGTGKSPVLRKSGRSRTVWQSDRHRSAPTLQNDLLYIDNIGTLVVCEAGKRQVWRSFLQSFSSGFILNR